MEKPRNKESTLSELKMMVLMKYRFNEQYEWRKNTNSWGGYAAEWVYRFDKRDPTIYMDFETLAIYKDHVKGKSRNELIEELLK